MMSKIKNNKKKMSKILRKKIKKRSKKIKMQINKKKMTKIMMVMPKTKKNNKIKKTKKTKTISQSKGDDSKEIPQNLKEQILKAMEEQEKKQQQAYQMRKTGKIKKRAKDW